MDVEALRAAWARRDDPVVSQQLVTHYAPLVVYVARRVAANAPLHVDRGDFISYGNFGLIDAVSRFNPDRGIKFETFASRRIRGAILDGLRSDDPLTRNARKRVRTLKSTIAELEAELSRQPTPNEVQAAMGITHAEMSHIYIDGAIAVPLAEQENDEDSFWPTHAVVDRRQDDPQVAVEVSGLRDRLADLLMRLPERDRTFIALYYCSGYSLVEVGRQLGVSDSRAGQIRLEIIRYLGKLGTSH